MTYLIIILGAVPVATIWGFFSAMGNDMWMDWKESREESTSHETGVQAK